MKGFKLAVLSICLLFVLPAPQARAQDYSSVSYQDFYDALSPYGQWMNDPQYGFVWVPDVGSDFRPYYTNGYWVMTDYGNTWVSDYDWGWAPFHYGRWTYDEYYGWLWIPGDEWGPAWVNWRSGGGYYGWAPLGPGISINISFGNYYVPSDWWVFAPQQYIYNPHFHQHVRGPRYNNNIISQTTVINNTYAYNHHTYATGPRRDEVEHVIQRPVQVYHLNDSRRPATTQVRNNQINIYRPSVSAVPRNSSNVRPQRVMETQRPINAPQQVRGGFNGASHPAVNNPGSYQPRNRDRDQSRPDADRNNQVQPQQVRPDRTYNTRPDADRSNQVQPQQTRPGRSYNAGQDQNVPRQDPRPSRNYSPRTEAVPQQQPVQQTRPAIEPSRPAYQQPPRQSYEQPRQAPQRPAMEQRPQVQQPRTERPAVEQPRREEARPAQQTNPEMNDRPGARHGR